MFPAVPDRLKLQEDSKERPKRDHDKAHHAHKDNLERPLHIPETRVGAPDEEDSEKDSAECADGKVRCDGPHVDALLRPRIPPNLLTAALVHEFACTLLAVVGSEDERVAADDDTAHHETDRDEEEAEASHEFRRGTGAGASLAAVHSPFGLEVERGWGLDVDVGRHHG